MSKVGYKLVGGLSEKELKEIHQNALRVLKEIGIDVSHKEILRLVSQHRGAKIKGTRIYFEPDLVEEILDLKKLPKSSPSTNNDHFQMSLSGYAPKILDLNTAKVRSSTLSDLIEMTKLGDALGMKGYAPVFPSDIPQKEAELATYKVCWENAQDIAGAGVFSSVKVFEYIYEMAQVIDKPFGFGMHMISPLKCDPFLLEIAYRFLGKKIDMGVGNMPMMGATSPIFLTGTLVQSVAEVLGGATLLKLISRGGKVNFSPFAYPFDMKYGGIGNGTPEFILINLVIRQIAQFYGIDSMAKTFNITSKEPDSQAALQSAAGTALLAFAGARNFGWAGTLSVNEVVFSGELLVIQSEIMEYVKQMVKGFEFNQATIGFNIIKENAGKSNFFDHLSTLENFRDIWISNLFENDDIKDWQRKGSKTIREKAREIAKQKIAKHHFELDKDKQKELNKIYERAKRSLL